MNSEKLANYAPTNFKFSPDDTYLTYLHASSHQVTRDGEVNESLRVGGWVGKMGHTHVAAAAAHPHRIHPHDIYLQMARQLWGINVPHASSAEPRQVSASAADA